MSGSKKTLGLLLALMLVVLAGCQIPPQNDQVVESAGNTTVLRGLAVINDADVGGALAVTGVSTFTGAVTATGGVVGAVTGAVTGNATIGTMILTAGTAITVTNGVAFAPTAAFQPIQAAGTVTPTITIPAAGRFTCIYNVSAQTINIADSGNQVLSAAWAAGQYDMLCGYSDGTRFIETDRSDN